METVFIIAKIKKQTNKQQQQKKNKTRCPWAAKCINIP